VGWPWLRFLGAIKSATCRIDRGVERVRKGGTLPMVAVAAIIGVFMFTAVAVWSENRRRERESYYRHELFQKMLDHPGGSVQAVQEMMQTLAQQEEIQRHRKQVEGTKVGGMVTAAAGIGLLAFLYFLVPGRAVYLVGLIPLLVGSALLIYAFGVARES
jgi:hypothetical protein